MRCKQCLMLLDDYVGRELNAQDTEQVATHLTVCAICARRYQELTREQNAYAQYLPGVEATPALWNNLQARIEDEKSVRALRLLPLLQSHANVYVGQEPECRRFLSAVLWIARSGAQWQL